LEELSVDKEIQQVLAQAQQALEHEVKMDQLNYDERILVAFLRNWEKVGSGDIPQEQLEQFH